MTSGPSGIGGPHPQDYSLQQPQGPGSAFNAGTQPASGFESFKTFLGPEGYEKFMQITCNMINNQMKKEQQQAKEASDKLKRALMGQDD